MKNLQFRVFFIALFLFPLLKFKDFYFHFKAYLTGNILNRIIIGNWKAVIISIILFLLFLIPLAYRKKANWMEYGLVTAFFVSLFVEMYGIPLTILFASKYFYNSSLIAPPNFIEFSLFGTSFGMDFPMLYAAIIMFIGTILILAGWITLYLGMKKNKFVTHGIYKYSRHPQYLGFILVILGWFIGWPTILTLIMSPILIYKYISVCKKEEKELLVKELNIKEYYSKTPFFI